MVITAFDPFLLTDRVLRGIEIAEAERQAFRGEFLSRSRETFSREFAKIKKARFLRVLSVDGELRPLVRILTAEGALNFHAYVVARRANGRLKWFDAHVYLGGELMSETMRRLVLPAFTQKNDGLLARLARGEGSYVKSIAQIQKVQELMRAGDAKGAKAILDGFPPELKNTKGILGVRLQVAQGLGGTEYLAVIDDWSRAFPGDPSLDLVCIDADFVRKDYLGVVRRLDSLQRQLGGDPYLEFLKANSLMMAGRFDECRTIARAVLAEDPSLASVYDVLLQIELDAKNHPGVVALLDEIEAAYPGADMAAGIAQPAAYATFRASPEYARWLEQRAARKAGSAQ